MAVLQVRSIDDQLYATLARRAALDHRSISQEVISILKKHLSTPEPRFADTTNSFLEMCGCWEDSREAEDIVVEIRADRQSARRFKDVF